MSSNIFFPFTTPGNYSYDSDVIEIISGEAKLKLQNNPGLSFTEDFADDTGFTYNPDEVEFVAGVLRQKDKTPTNSTSWATYTSDINLNNGSGTLTGTATGGASVLNNKLDLTHGDRRYVSYSAVGNANFNQTGCIKFKYTPNHITPIGDHYVFTILKSLGDSTNQIAYRDTSGHQRLHIYDSTNTLIEEMYFGYNQWVSGQTYEIEFNIDITAGASRMFIDGEQFGATKTSTGTRDNNINLTLIGTRYDGNTDSNFAMEDFIVFDSVQHTANYTPGYSLKEAKYVASDVILPTMSYLGAGDLLSIEDIIKTGTNTPPHSVVANTSSIIITLNFELSNVTQQDITNLEVDYTGQIYPVTDPDIITNSSFGASELLSFDNTITASGGDQIKHTIIVGGVDYWNNGGSIQTSDATYSQSNTSSELEAVITEFINTRSTVKIRSFISSNDGTTSPTLDQIVVSYNSALPSPTLPIFFDLEGFIYEAGQAKQSLQITARPYLKGIASEGIFAAYSFGNVGIVTNNEGWFEGELFVLPEGGYWELKVSKQRYKMVLPSGITEGSIVNIKDVTLYPIQ